MIIHIFKSSIPPSSRYYIHPFLQIILVQNSYCGKEMNQFLPPSNSTALAFSSVFFPVQCLEDKEYTICLLQIRKLAQCLEDKEYTIFLLLHMEPRTHRRRIELEDKAKVVVASVVGGL